MSLENIKTKIMDEAKVEAKKLLDSAETEAQKINSGNNTVLNAYNSKREQEIELAVKLYKDKTLAQARLSAKRSIIEKREEIIENVLTDVVKVDKKGKDYAKFMKTIVEDSLKLLSGDIVVHCNKADEKWVSDNAGDTKIIFKTAELLGGAIFEDSTGRKINESVDSRLNQVRLDIRRKAVEILEGKK